MPSSGGSVAEFVVLLKMVKQVFNVFIDYIHAELSFYLGRTHSTFRYVGRLRPPRNNRQHLYLD